MAENPSAWRATKVAIIGTSILVAICTLMYGVTKLFDWQLGSWGFPIFMLIYAFASIWIIAFRLLPARQKGGDA